MASEPQFKQDSTSSNMCGATLMNTDYGMIIADIVGKRDNITVTTAPSLIRLDAVGSMELEFDELSDAVGADFDQSDFEEVMSTHYGRMVLLDDKIVFFANPEDAAEYIGFDLTPVDEE